MLTGTTSIDYAENGEAAVATYTATDPEGETITWTVTGTDAGVFSITAGVLEFLTSPNYENPVDEDADNAYEVGVKATDLPGMSATVEVTVTVTDVTDPSIVLVIADDGGHEIIGAYGSGQYRTPRIDERAAVGVRFTNAYSKPGTTQSRVALMTGRSNVRNYVDARTLLPGQYTIADLFSEAGYATVIAGKWQLQGAPNRVTGVPADESGFDTYCLFHTAGTSDRRYRRPFIECDGEVIDSSVSDYGPDLFVDFLLEFIESNRNVPFLAYYPMVLPHAPFDPPPDGQCSDATDKQCVFEDMVAYLDKNVGRVWDKLEALELLDNTVFLFTSDNGTPPWFVSLLDGESIDGDKRTPTDGGTHVPLIVHVPGREGGQVLDDLVDFTDFLPTLADAAGLKIPDNVTLDGSSFWDRLQGGSGDPRSWIYSYYFPEPYGDMFDSPASHPAIAYVRDKRYKLYSSGELFDLSVDRLEVHPLPGDDEDSSEARAKLQTALDSMPEQGQEIRWSHVSRDVLASALASQPRPRWRPVLKSATVDGDAITLEYVGILNPNRNPGADAFRAAVDGVERTVSAVSLSERDVTLNPRFPGKGWPDRYSKLHSGSERATAQEPEGGAHCIGPVRRTRQERDSARPCASNHRVHR